MKAISPEDEFLIEATCPGKPNRSWTRSTLGVAQHIADQAIRTLGYTRAEVRNTFGGHLSDVLYEVTGNANVLYPRDMVTEQRKKRETPEEKKILDRVAPERHDIGPIDRPYTFNHWGYVDKGR